MGVGYIKEITTRPDGSAEVRIIFDGPSGQFTLWGPFECETKESAQIALDTALEKLKSR